MPRDRRRRSKEFIVESKNRVLIAGMTHEVGGMENYVINLYRQIDRNVIQFDFINDSPGNKIPFQDEIEALGGRVFDVPMIHKGPLQHYVRLHQIFSNTEYKAVHYNVSWNIRNVDVFQFAKRHHVPIRILHVHTTSNENGNTTGIQKLREDRAFKLKDRLITHRFACSESAGKWMFGDYPFEVVPNGIDTDRFDYNPSVRQEIRAKNGVTNETIYGTVARLYKVKNPLFLVDIFYEIHKLQPNSKFWHIGGGGLQEEMEKKILALGLSNSYCLLGRKDNVPDYLNAMDFFIFPSLFEGFGISLLEAQNSGLKCLASDTIPEAVNVTGNVLFYSLKHDAKHWAEVAVRNSRYNRESGKISLINAHYSIVQTAADFQNLILSSSK